MIEIRAFKPPPGVREVQLDGTLVQAWDYARALHQYDRALNIFVGYRVAPVTTKGHVSVFAFILRVDNAHKVREDGFIVTFALEPIKCQFIVQACGKLFPFFEVIIHASGQGVDDHEDICIVRCGCGDGVWGYVDVERDAGLFDFIFGHCLSCVVATGICGGGINTQI